MSQVVVRIPRIELRLLFRAWEVENKVKQGQIRLRLVPEMQVWQGAFFELYLPDNDWRLGLAHRASYPNAPLDPKFVFLDDIVLRAIQPPGEGTRP